MFRYDNGGAAFYDWTQDAAQAAIAADYGLFDTTQTVRSYTEVGTPFITSIWAQCMGLAGQMHYTLPIDPSTGAPTTLGAMFNPSTGVSSTPNLTYAEEWVQALMTEAYRKSPLYWHYSMRHAPSPSAVCARGPQFYPTGTMMMMMAPSSSSSRTAAAAAAAANNISQFGWAALTLGGQGSDCFCGWWRNATHCAPPPALCAALVEFEYNARTAALCPLYAASEFDVEPAVRALLASGQPWEWPCPALMASDHWGFLGTAGADPWARIQSQGPSGLRTGALRWQTSTLLTDPSRRKEAVPPPLAHCNLSPPQSLVDHMVDDLFPAAQGVRQGALVSNCLRYVIELARLNAYTQAGLVIPASEQAQVAATWRKRCDMKLRQATTCETYGVYYIQGDATAQCPLFSVAPQYAHALTPSCLVLYNGAAYDPCLCDARFCAATSVVLNPASMLRPICQVPHPRDQVVDFETGLVTEWPPDNYTSSPPPTVVPPSLVWREGGREGGRMEG